MITGFINFSFFDLLDILLVAFIIYQVYYLIRGTVAIKIFFGILAIYLLWKLVDAFQLNMLEEILGQFIGVGVIALLIVFQNELRQFLLMIGNQDIISGNKSRFIRKLFADKDDEDIWDCDALLDACESMSSTKTGALIVVANSSDPEHFITSSTPLDAALSTTMIESIFFKNSPLHDGAVVIKKGRISSARGVLPVSESNKMDGSMGMRHRAALGISEMTDSFVIVVSEQTGKLSLAHDGTLIPNMSRTELGRILQKRHDGQPG
jgi:diadenylate cyclase